MEPPKAAASIHEEQRIMSKKEPKEFAKVKPSRPVSSAEQNEKKTLKSATSKGIFSIKDMDLRDESRSRTRQIITETGKRSITRKRPAEEISGFKKEFLESDSFCRVTFKLPKVAVGQAESVTVVGDFNGWDKNASPMKKMRNGDFAITLELPCKGEYRFRYLIDGHRWENDWSADRYQPNPHGSEDSVVIV